MSCVLRFVKINCALDHTRVKTATKIYFADDSDCFHKISVFFLDFRPFFFGNVIFASSTPRFSAPETVPNTLKTPILQYAI